MSLRAVLFDFDGTLADSEPLITESMVYALGRHGFEVTTERVSHVFGPPFDRMVQILAGDLDRDQAAAIRATYFEHYNACQLPRIQPVHGAERLLDDLAARGIAVALVTNKVEASARRQLAAMHWQDRFAVVIGADTASLPKPAPDPALFALERLGVPPEEAAFVGDQEPDVACGVAAGIPVVIGLCFARAPEPLAAAGATCVARTLDEVRAVLLDEVIGDA